MMNAFYAKARANADLNFTVSSWHQFGTLKNDTEIVCAAGFGKVLKVLDKRTQKHYAMKLQPKDSWTFSTTKFFECCRGGCCLGPDAGILRFNAP